MLTPAAVYACGGLHFVVYACGGLHYVVYACGSLNFLIFKSERDLHKLLLQFNDTFFNCC